MYRSHLKIVGKQRPRGTCWPRGSCMRPSPDSAVRVRALAGTLHCVLGQDTLSASGSPPRCINGYG